MINDAGLRERLDRGISVTLILGAGVSTPRGVPGWEKLLRSAWRLTFGQDPYAADADLLDRARAECRRAGIREEFVRRLGLARHPFELQFAFEDIFTHLRWSAAKSGLRKQLGLPRHRRKARPQSNEQQAAELFVDILRKVLHEHVRPRSRARAKVDTLSLVASAVLNSAKSPEAERRVSQVITFNVDDLLEQQVNFGCRRRIPYAVPISRACDYRPLPTRRAIAVYHLHGFVPSVGAHYPHLSEDGWIDKPTPPLESLVFTDEQYWRTVGQPAGFAARVFANALTGSCVFIGLSMTDVNIIRWLAQDAIERSDDFRRLASAWEDPTEIEFNVGEELSRHYWICTGGAQPECMGQISGANVVSRALARRGVATIGIPDWDAPQFHKWWRSCFLKPG